MTAPTLPRSPRLHTLALALEPRMMFDAAAVATAADTAAQAEAQNQAPTLSAEASHAAHTGDETDANASRTVSSSSTLDVAADPAQLPSIGGDSGALDYAGTTDASTLAGARDSVVSSDGKFVYVASIPSEGSASVSVFSRAADGSLKQLHFNAALALSGNQLPASRVQLNGHSSLDGATLENIIINSLGGELSGQAELNWQQQLSWLGSLQLTQIQPGQFWPDYSGELNGNMQLSGNLTQQGGWQLALPQLRAGDHYSLFLTGNAAKPVLKGLLSSTEPVAK